MNPRRGPGLKDAPCIADLKEKGILPVDRDTLISIQTLTPGRVNLNCTRHMGINGSDVRDLTKATIDGHIQNLKLVEVLRQYIPGFENARLVRFYPFLGIRETRRVAVVNNALCQGCGACTVVCPSGAMDLQGFSNRQIIAEVDAICR